MKPAAARPELRLAYRRAEEPDTLMRVCPFCHGRLTWNYYGKQDDPADERAFCSTHGPVRLWRIINLDENTLVGIGHVSAEVGGRVFERPIPLTLVRPASRRWKRRLGPKARERDAAVKAREGVQLGLFRHIERTMFAQKI